MNRIRKSRKMGGVQQTTGEGELVEKLRNIEKHDTIEIYQTYFLELQWALLSARRVDNVCCSRFNSTLTMCS
jgi:hypothetical protein